MTISKWIVLSILTFSLGAFAGQCQGGPHHEHGSSGEHGGGGRGPANFENHEHHQHHECRDDDDDCNETGGGTHQHSNHPHTPSVTNGGPPNRPATAVPTNPGNTPTTPGNVPTNPTNPGTPIVFVPPPLPGTPSGNPPQVNQPQPPNNNTSQPPSGGTSSNPTPTTQHGNNGIGNGLDPQPPGNPKPNDTAGTTPGNSGNKSGGNQSNGK